MTTLYPIDRSLEYRVTQRFLVAAKSFEHAAEKVEAFVDDAWDAEASLRSGVVQVSDTMDQIGNSQEIVPGEPPIAGKDACIDPSLNKIMLQAKASEMFALLKQISESPAMFHANVSDIGLKVKTFVEGVQLELDEPAATLLKVIAQADIKATPRSARRRP